VCSWKERFFPFFFPPPTRERWLIRTPLFRILSTASRHTPVDPLSRDWKSSNKASFPFPLKKKGLYTSPFLSVRCQQSGCKILLIALPARSNPSPPPSIQGLTCSPGGWYFLPFLLIQKNFHQSLLFFPVLTIALLRAC